MMSMNRLQVFFLPSFSIYLTNLSRVLNSVALGTLSLTSTSITKGKNLHSLVSGTFAK